MSDTRAVTSAMAPQKTMMVNARGEKREDAISGPKIAKRVMTIKVSGKRINTLSLSGQLDRENDFETGLEGRRSGRTSFTR